MLTFYKRFTYLHWIILWAILSIVFNMTGTDWGIVASVISAIILVAGLLFGFGRWYYRKWQLNDPVRIISKFIGSTSSDVQYLSIALDTKTKIAIQSVCLYFTNEKYEELENSPSIKGLYHCLSGEILKDNSISAYSTVDNRWFWLNEPSFQQPSISIALAFIAKVSFDGLLKFDLDCTETGRIIYDLPFKITETKEIYFNKGKKGSLLVKKERGN
jgi:hypothetical protein